MPLYCYCEQKLKKGFPVFVTRYFRKQTDISRLTVPTRGGSRSPQDKRDTHPRPWPPDPARLLPPLWAPTLSAVLGAGFSFPLAINMALIFAATAAAASSAPEGAAELSEPATVEPPSPPPGKGRPGSGAVPGRRKAGAGPGWSHLLRRLGEREASAPGCPVGAPPPAAPRPRRASAVPQPRPRTRRTRVPASPARGRRVALRSATR